MNNLKCSICYKTAEVEAYGNSYCIPCYEDSPYFAEANARKRMKEEDYKKEHGNE